jgi:ADP-ribose pyrophosphatase
MKRPKKRTPRRAETLYEGRFKRLVREDGWEFMERVSASGIVVVLGVTDENKVILVEQYRVPVGRRVIEFPAGLARDTEQTRRESLAKAAERELLEETGYRARKLKLLVRGPAASASSRDLMSVFRAYGLQKVARGGGDETESIRVHEVDLKGIRAWLTKKERQGCLVDPKIYAGLYLLDKASRIPPS